MTSFDPTKLHASYFDTIDDSYYDDYQIKGKELKAKKSWNINDAIPDEAFEEAERLANVSPYIKKGIPDDVENVTVQIFAHLYELADRTERKEIENVVAPTPHIHSPTPKKHSYSRSSSFLQSDSNFWEDDDLDYPVRTENVLQNVLNAVTDIFLGIKFSEEPEQKSHNEMGDLLKKDQITWKHMKPNYSGYFQIKMEQVFENARELLKQRLKEEESAYMRRITFYAGLIIATVGKLIGQKLLVAGGLAGSSIMFIYMVKQYVTSSMYQMQQESDLKLSIDSIYYEAAKHRLNVNNALDS